MGHKYDKIFVVVGFCMVTVINIIAPVAPVYSARKFHWRDWAANTPLSVSGPVLATLLL